MRTRRGGRAARVVQLRPSLHVCLALLVTALILGGCIAPERTTGSPTVSSPASSNSPPTSSPPAWWVPGQGASWYIQYEGDLEIPSDVEVVNLDESTPSTVIDELRTRGQHAVCYVNAGAVEDWRGDADRFPDEVIGNRMEGWPDERWLDIRRLDLLLPIMADRMASCRAKGFEAIDPDNVNGFENDSGFELTATDATRYIEALATLAHDQGLAIGLKNALPIIDDTVDVVDFAVNEQCVAYNECEAYRPFIEANKAVFHIEYEGELETICASRPAEFSTVLKNLALDAPSATCD